MVALSERLRAYLARDWREDLEPVWREFFEGIEPDLGGLPNWEVPDLFPDRLGLDHPRAPGEAIQVSHMLRAFDGLTPAQVRVIILGQDPYPRRASATGRAFEDGEWERDDVVAAAKSLRRLLQSAAATEYAGLGICEVGNDWDRVRQAIQNGDLTRPSVPEYFDALADQGVLSVNAAWTFTGRNLNEETHLDLHLRVWKPVMAHLLGRLCWRNGCPPLVFLLLGKDARNLFQYAVARNFGNDIIDKATRIATVYCDHPAYRGGGPYFRCGNPLTRVNRALQHLGAGPVRWWPAPPQVAV